MKNYQIYIFDIQNEEKKKYYFFKNILTGLRILPSLFSPAVALQVKAG